MYLSVSEAAERFNLSKRRVQLLCEQGRIEGAGMVSGVWLIPDTATKPKDLRRSPDFAEQPSLFESETTVLTLDDVCKALSISKATAKNWVRLNKLTPDINGKYFSPTYVDTLVDAIRVGRDERLKSRRNKSAISGNALYKDYVHTPENRECVEEILDLAEIKSDNDLRVALANLSVQAYYQSRGIAYDSNTVLPEFLARYRDHAIRTSINSSSDSPASPNSPSSLNSRSSNSHSFSEVSLSGDNVQNGGSRNVDSALRADGSLSPADALANAGVANADALRADNLPGATNSMVAASFDSQFDSQSEWLEPLDRDAVFYGLITDLLHSDTVAPETLARLHDTLEQGIRFVKGEDSLGYAYISLRDLGERKQTGAYYTPENVVDELIRGLYEHDALAFKTVCDPCCGSGNFLIGLAQRGINCANMYGQDIDPISVYIARINLSLIDPKLSLEDLREHILIGNTLLDKPDRTFDVIFGNPPWGSVFTDDEIIRYRSVYRTAGSASLEAYDLFIERAMDMLANDGMLAFVLPQSVLTVAAHEAARQILLSKCSLAFVSYLGNVFSGVQSPCVVLGAAKRHPGRIAGCTVRADGRMFSIRRDRHSADETLPLNMTDAEYDCLQAIINVDNAAYLKGNATFALGIVTGNNRRYVAQECRDGYEAVLRGSDILRYGIKPASRYLRFDPDVFQQVAPEHVYRAPEKLLYRFISEMPVFAYDDAQTLSLNSCNILIPHIPGLDMKYVLAILNSSVTAYMLMQQYHSVKLLRSHIERIPIPIADDRTQDDIVRQVNRIMRASGPVDDLYDDLDDTIMKLYGLSHRHVTTIRKALAGHSTLLR